MTRILLPPNYIKDLEGPLVFLAGPIQGATDWQSDAIGCLHAMEPELFVASPRRNEKFTGQFAGDKYNQQVEWEHHHLNRAAEEGVILFWLARESEHDCARAYAQTTRFELGEACERHRHTHCWVVVGIEDGFTNARYLRKTISEKYPTIPILNTLEETCNAAVERAAGH